MYIFMPLCSPFHYVHLYLNRRFSQPISEVGDPAARLAVLSRNPKLGFLNITAYKEPQLRFLVGSAVQDLIRSTFVFLLLMRFIAFPTLVLSVTKADIIRNDLLLKKVTVHIGIYCSFNSNYRPNSLRRKHPPAHHH